MVKKFVYNGSLDQKFILDNPFIDTSTISVFISDNENEEGIKYSAVENIIDINNTSQIYFVREVQDEKYEIRFGDGIFGKKLGDSGDGSYITVKYLVTEGENANGVSDFTFSGSLRNKQNAIFFI